MDFQYDHKDDLSFQDINDDNNAYGSINPQDYNDEMIFSQDNVNLSDTKEEEESDNEYNYEEKEEKEDNNENNDEEEEKEGNNDDNNNQVEEEHNNDEEKRNNEKKEIHQIIEILDEDKIPFCNDEFALFGWASEKRKPKDSGGLPKNENPKVKIRSGGLLKNGKRRTFKIRSGGFPSFQGTEKTKDSVSVFQRMEKTKILQWASEEQPKTKIRKFRDL
ncbi:uncharacterized protein OCT59_007612 [Rhizophagus irregularis]|uniref:uncharacterized protein n=1 Tax=Rhizophagus irregularis TaxID=588596 RepID=UPI003330603D|nr:hypothetical protein OCT59_007612 [Rhizophagus irregularis]